MDDGIWRTVGGRRIFIKNGQSLEDAMYESGKFNEIIRRSKHKQLKLPKIEYAVLVSEINTYYGKNESRPVLGKCVGDYFYMFDNLGFNNYNVFKKLKISGNEKRIKHIMEEMNSDD